jgi:hypothetical protein
MMKLHRALDEPRLLLSCQVFPLVLFIFSLSLCTRVSAALNIKQPLPTLLTNFTI